MIYIMKRESIATGEHYHIYNRGNNKENIFLDDRDWTRFLFLVISHQTNLPITNIGHYVSNFIGRQRFDISEKMTKKILENRIVELEAFALMPNHFHLLVYEKEKGGISKYMQRIQDSHTKYINIKYRKSGHVFQGVFQRVRIQTNEQLLHLSAYIHRNARGFKQWKDKEHLYPWSSYQDYTDRNRWDKFLKQDLIKDQFSNLEEYKEFIETSGTKLLLDDKLILD